MGFSTKATEIMPEGNGAKYPTLDSDLRDFMARCMADEPGNRPSLAEMLEIAEAAVRNKTPETFEDSELETDRAIRDIIQEYIYDADDDEDRAMEAKKLQEMG